MTAESMRARISHLKTVTDPDVALAQSLGDALTDEDDSGLLVEEFPPWFLAFFEFYLPRLLIAAAGLLVAVQAWRWIRP